MTGPETAELEAVDAALAGRPVPPEHAELAELTLLLRDDRPEPAPAWAATLDRQVRTGFPPKPRRRPRLRIPFTAGTVATAIACSLLALLIAVAVLAPGDGDDASEGAGGGGEAATQAAAPESDAAGGGAESRSRGRGSRLSTDADDAASGAGATGIAPAPPTGGDPGSDSRERRHVERSATMTLAAPPRDIDSVASGVGRVAAELGGFVAASSVSSTHGGSLELRVPSDRLDRAVQRLSGLARVRELTRQSRDITSSVVSARERLNDARTERKSLLRQLAEADTVNETESIRARLKIVSGEIAAARARLRSVNNRAQFANIGVTLIADRSTDDEGAWTPGDALDDAGRVLEVIAGVTLIALAVALPLLLAGGLGWLARRGLTRRRRERALDMA